MLIVDIKLFATTKNPNRIIDSETKIGISTEMESSKEKCFMIIMKRK